MRISGGSAIFGRPSIRRSFSSESAQGQKVNEGENKDANQLPPRQSATKSDAKLKLIQYEIADKEACNVLKNLCEQALFSLPPQDQPVEIPDMLSGILQLGSLCKRIGYQKEEVEKKLVEQAKRYDRELAEKNSLISQLEQIITRNQADNLKLADQISEINIKNNQKVAMLSRDLFNIREQLNEAKAENQKLSGKVQYQEKRMMDMPRIEEAYLRQARGIVRQQEVANTMTKIELKKTEEEAKLCQFYKAKAKSLEEALEAQRAELEAVQTQSRLNFTKYQQVSQTLGNIKNKSRDYNGLLANQQTASGRARQGQGMSRPASAPALRHSSSKQLMDSAKKSIGNGEDEAKSSYYTAKTEDIEGKLRHEIDCLKLELENKNERIQKLFKQLSRARAYPLLSVGGVERKKTSKEKWDIVDAEELVDRMEEKYKQATIAHNNSSLNVNNRAGHEDDLHLTAEEEKEEEQLAQRRIAEAVQVQEDYNERLVTRKSKNPPHIAAIRSSKSFARND